MGCPGPSADSDLVECIDCGEVFEDHDADEYGSLSCSPRCTVCKLRTCDRTITAPEGVPVTMRQLVYGEVPDTREAREAIRSVAGGGR